MLITIQYHESLMATMIGLICVGYGEIPQDKPAVENLIHTIRQTPFDHEIIAYFQQAKSRQSIYNDFYPYGSALQAAAFFIEDDAFTDFDAFQNFIVSTGIQTQDDAFYQWVKGLPHVLQRMRNHPSYALVVERYNAILESRHSAYQQTLSKVQRTIDGFTSQAVYIVFCPVPIQTYSVDYVKQGITTTVICEYPQGIHVLHEFLHPYIAHYRTGIQAWVKEQAFDRIVDVPKAIASGYMWDDSMESKTHMVEEAIVRGMSVRMSEMKESDKAAFVRWNVDMGFYMVDRVYQALDGMDINEENLETIIHHIMTG